MCGIAGIVAADGESPAAAMVALTNALAHRGPDGAGYWRLAGSEAGLCEPEALSDRADIVLGHRRLSIVDLDGGAEPMPNEDGSVWLVFNGEIYNHEELRVELERCGHRYRTRCDAETLIHGWEEWGDGLFGRLNGIFAFAIADVRRRELVLVRDPIGVKPLYVGTSGRRTWFASELAAAGEAGLLSGRLVPEALKLFLTFRFIPSPYTIDACAWRVPPGHYLRLQTGEAGQDPRFLAYESKIRSSASPHSRAGWREALGAELDRAVNRQLMADVPVASLLSGGVDSSLVTQMMATHLEYAPQAFAIGIQSEGPEIETIAADRAARAIGVPCHSTVLADADFVSRWPSLLSQFGEPTSNSSSLMIQLICEEVGKSHKVALCGQGADELLGGYPRHMTERLYRLGRLFPALSRAATGAAFGPESAARLSRALSSRERADRYAQIFSVLPPEVVDSLVRGECPGAAELARSVVEPWIGEGADDTVNDLLRVDVRMSLADDLLVVADHCAMRSSVELRVPFLDLAFVELVERMPSRFKVSMLGERKWLYRKAAADRLPQELAQQLCPPTKRLQRKRGFSQPLVSWFDEAGGLLADPAKWAGPLFDLPELSPDGVSAALGVAGTTGLTRRRSVMYALARWLEANRRSAPALA